MAKVSKNQLLIVFIAIIIIGGLVIFNTPSKAQPASTLKIHYYHQGKEVFKNQYSVIDGQQVDAIGFDITVYNNGNTLLKNLKLSSASPIQFQQVLPAISGDLTPGQSKLFSTTANIPVAQFEGQTVAFSIYITATDDYSKQDITKGDSVSVTVYKEKANAQDYYASPNKCGTGWDSCGCPYGYIVDTAHPIELYMSTVWECFSYTYNDYAYIGHINYVSDPKNCLSFGGDYGSTGRSGTNSIPGMGVCYHPAYKDYMLSFPQCPGQNGCGGKVDSCPCQTGYLCQGSVSMFDTGSFGGFTQCLRKDTNPV